MQYVKIDLGSTRAYTYAWAGETPLEVGDWVVVPGNSFQPNPSTGKVLRVLPKCDFTGKVAILRQRIDVRKPQTIHSGTETVSRAQGKAIPKPQRAEYGYDDNVLGQESGPIHETYRGKDAYDTEDDRSDYSWGEGD